MNPRTYYVIADDGQRYGPVDIATLNQWIADGRIVRHTNLEDAETGVRMAAPAIPGLLLPVPASNSFLNDNFVQMGWASGALSVILGLSGTFFSLVAAALGLLWSIRAREAKYEYANLMIALCVFGGVLFWVNHLLAWSVIAWIFNHIRR
jgi:hypothetical protein